MEKTNKTNISNIKEVVQFIIQNLDNVKRIILFGSVADKNNGNDIDLALVTAPWVGDIKDLYLDVGRRIRIVCQKYPVDYFIIPINLLNNENYKNSPFLRIINHKGRILYMDTESINACISDARLDYEQSCYLFRGGYYKGASSFAQQSIEKFIKTKLLQFGWELQKVHQIVFLVSELKSYGYTITDVTDDEVSFIDNIYKGRYPGEQGLLPYGEPSQDDAQKAINIAYRIGAVMGQKLEKLKFVKEE